MRIGPFKLVHWKKIEEIQWTLTAAQNSLSDARCALPTKPLSSTGQSSVSIRLDRADAKIEEAIQELIC